MRAWTNVARLVAGTAALWMACQVAAEDGAALGPRADAVASAPCVGGGCPPKAATFGHYQPQWREWPGEPRPDRTFPQSIGAEPLPTPTGTAPPALPRETMTPGRSKPSGPVLPGLPTELPPMSPGPESIFPPDKPLRIEERPLIPKEPDRPSPLEPVPPLPGMPGGTLPGMEPIPGPGLPLEPEPRPSPLAPVEPEPKPSPKVPADTPKPSTIPGLPLEPATPFREETPRGGPLPGLPSPKPLPASEPAPKAGPPSARSAAPPEAPLPVQAILPRRDEGGVARPQRPAFQENEPEPVEPWAEPRPWKPEPSHETSQARMNDPWAVPSSWKAPVEPLPRDEPQRAPVRQSAPPVQERGVPRDSRPAEAATYDRVERPALPASPRAERPAAALNSPMCLDGYCPVTLAESEQWLAGDPRFGVQHQGRTYLMSGDAQRQRFLANPNRYAPVMGGADPVLTVDQKSSTPGRTEHCVVYDGRLYMFSSAETLARFHQNPKKYSAAAARGAY